MSHHAHLFWSNLVEYLSFLSSSITLGHILFTSLCYYTYCNFCIYLQVVQYMVPLRARLGAVGNGSEVEALVEIFVQEFLHPWWQYWFTMFIRDVSCSQQDMSCVRATRYIA